MMIEQENSEQLAGIVPRWEWRTFGAQFGLAEAAFDAMAPVGETQSDELYFLAPGGANVKIRDRLLDIKELQETDGDGLERWTPTMKQAFPLSRTHVAAVVVAFGVSPIAPERDAYTLDQFLDEIVEPMPDVRVVEVHKHRIRYLVGGCMSELTDVTVDGVPTRTIAAESEDEPAVLSAVRDLGLGGFINMSYPSGLRATIDGGPARYAVIDIGTNSVKFNLGERDADGMWVTLIDRAEVTRLGEDLDASNVIIPVARDRTTTAIAHMVEEAEASGVYAIVAVGTAGLRMADNADEVITAIKECAGISVEVISGTEESRLAYLAARSSLGRDAGTVAVFDSGGGSSQFTFGEGLRITDRFSVNVGAVRYTERFGLNAAVSDSDLEVAIASISTDLDVLRDGTSLEALIGMGGTLTNIAAVSHSMATYDPDVIQGTIIDIAEIDRQINVYRTMDASERAGIVGLQENRAAVILAGACIVRTIMGKLGQRSVTVSDRGLRHGLIVERFSARLPG
jgi:exopolyphosphatase/guanosine-5'-triphosphate,3'-diphosphate pyrophosphatase